MIKNLIFDWSGTLADDLAAVLIATNGVLSHYGRKSLLREEFRTSFRLPYTEFYQELLPDVPLEAVKELYVRHFPTAETANVPLLPHAREFLQYAASTGRRMAVMSSAPVEHVQAQAEANGVEHFFEVIWGGIVDKRVAVHQMLKEFHLKPQETAFIGDMRHDIDAGKAGGVLSIATATGYEPVSVLMESAPDLLVQDLSQLPKLMGLGAAIPLATVGALIFNHHGEILLVKTHKWSDRWGIAGGKIRRGETALEALRRETREETALELCDIRLLMVQDCIEPEEFETSAHFLLMNYTARCVSDQPEVHLNDEAEAFCWVTPEASLNMDLNHPTRLLIQAVLKQDVSTIIS